LPNFQRVEENPAFDNTAYSFGVATVSVRDCLAHLQTLLQQEILPSISTRKIRLLRVLGSTESKRPQMMRRIETMQMLREYCNQYVAAKTDFSRSPVVHQFDACIHPKFQELPGETAKIN
jgi:hypothetical protein